MKKISFLVCLVLFTFSLAQAADKDPQPDPAKISALLAQIQLFNLSKDGKAVSEDDFQKWKLKGGDLQVSGVPGVTFINCTPWFKEGVMTKRAIVVGLTEPTPYTVVSIRYNRDEETDFIFFQRTVKGDEEFISLPKGVSAWWFVRDDHLKILLFKKLEKGRAISVPPLLNPAPG